jgi:diguanylate cyclase (GGDEF)-like protein
MQRPGASGATGTPGGEASPDLALSRQGIDILLPLHLVVRPDGRILCSGRTMARIVPRVLAEGATFLDSFTVVKPRGVQTMEALIDIASRRVTVATRTEEPVTLRGVAVATGDGALLFSFALGTRLAEVVERFGLKEQDFSPGDNSVDLLYVVQTQSSLLADTNALLERVQIARDEAESHAHTDMLTGLANRRALARWLQQRMTRPAARLALLHVDLDQFKYANDTHGHAAGDRLLVQVARLLSSDSNLAFVARIGGDEFVAIIDGTDAEAASGVARRLIDQISMPVPFADQVLKVGASIGIAFGGDAVPGDADRLLVDADLALYAAKRAGRNRYRFFAPAMRESYEATNQLASEIAQAIEARAFEPWFQPKVDLAAGTVCGVEALVRWRHPVRGILSPADFLYVADQAKLLDRIDDQVFEQALAAFRQWQRDGIAPQHVSINMTASRLSRADCADRLMWAVDRAGLSGENVVLEILETVLLDDEVSVALSSLRRLAAAGFRLQLDDFGTGHAAIANLTKFPVDAVKIDRSFVTGIDRDPALSTITAAMVDLALKLGITPIAEGVDADEQVAVLRAMGCDLFQGFCISPPLSPDQIVAWLRRAPALLEGRASVQTLAARA